MFLGMQEFDFAQIPSNLPKTFLLAHLLVARPRPPMFSRPRPLFQDQDRFFKDHQIINPRPQKMFPNRKNQASYAGFDQSCRKKPAYYRFSSQVLLHPKLGS